ncbi:Bifunctional aspartokinase/homoserine dehydrogenase 2 [Candidatus Arsenophonus lipoptenae]|uniref:Aspartokinase n=1 Tax=Candidatus Arsenophonus lipoptenae TaxID=634113 RepID=A0A0X9VUW2_9GAMM|nr:aspartate kinase [Candidatus Arsenophonus lipoptenae]AMA64908.1 Bifunctional aspartokinase/homoserine dehydrogenase 2 [Candidatus Arsenophonus lipoptenae]
MNIVITEKTKYNHRQLHKFGGSSLTNVQGYRMVANIMANYSKSGDLVVVSAAGTTTNKLINWINYSHTNHIVANKLLKSISNYQQELIDGLLPNNKSKILKMAFLKDLKKLNNLINKSINNDIYSEIVGHGEIWSARLMSAVLENAGLSSYWLDARLFLRTEFIGQPKIDENLSRPLLQHFLQKYPNKWLVITGFIAQNKQGRMVLLGRNGSDYSATQIGALAKVNKVTIWSDVTGIYNADPRKVKDASLLPILGFNEANELARLSTPVLHPRTLQPLAINNIDLQLKCSYNPEQGSTKIGHFFTQDTGVKIITSHEDICLIELYLMNRQNFFQTYKNINLFLNKNQILPLATGLNSDKKLIQLCYTSEIANASLNLLQQVQLEKIVLRHHFAIIAIIGSDIIKNSINTHLFYQQLKDQPVEFIWHSNKGISLVAVLHTTKTSNLVRLLHQSLFRNKQYY